MVNVIRVRGVKGVGREGDGEGAREISSTWNMARRRRLFTLVVPNRIKVLVGDLNDTEGGGGKRRAGWVPH